jgi:hypothetical protein
VTCNKKNKCVMQTLLPATLWNLKSSVPVMQWGGQNAQYQITNTTELYSCKFALARQRRQWPPPTKLHNITPQKTAIFTFNTNSYELFRIMI